MSWATFGISAVSEATCSDQAPVGSTRTLPLSRPNTSTARPKVPCTPIRSTVIPLPVCAVVVPVVLVAAPRPNARLARFTLRLIDSTTMPSAKPKSARPTAGFWSVSGPSENDPLVVFSPGAEGSIVNDWDWLAGFVARVPSAATVATRPPVKETSTVPVPNRPVAFEVSESAKKYR